MGRRVVAAEPGQCMFRLGQPRKIGIGILPVGEEFRMLSLRLRRILLEHGGTSSAEFRKRVERADRILAAVIENLPEFRSCLIGPSQLQKRQPAHILWPELSRGLVARGLQGLDRRLSITLFDRYCSFYDGT